MTNTNPNPEPDDEGLSLTAEIILLVIATLTLIGFIAYLAMMFFRRPLTELERSLVEDPEPIHDHDKPI